MKTDLSDSSNSKTPLLNFFSRVKQWFTVRRCVVLGIAFILFCFFYNPTKIDLIFKAVPEEASTVVYVNSLSKEWDGAMENNMLMGSISVILEEDLTKLRTNEGLKWTLRLLTGKDSVVAIIDANDNGEIEIEAGDYIVGATSVGFRRRIMEFLWRIKYVPGLGKLGVTEEGIRYINFSKTESEPSSSNPVLALDVIDGILCVAYSANPADINSVTTRIDKKTSLSSVFKDTEQPWNLRVSKALPKNYIFWHEAMDGVFGVSSLASESLEIRILNTNKDLCGAFSKISSFADQNISREFVAAQHVAVDDVLLCVALNNSILDVFKQYYPDLIEFETADCLTFMTLLNGKYAFNILGNPIPSLHISSTQTGIAPDSTPMEKELASLLKDHKKNYIDSNNWRNTYTPKVRGFDLLAANTKFGLYSEQKGKIYSQGVAAVNDVKAGTELPKESAQGAYTLGDMVDFFGEECGTSYFIAYCNLKELSKFTNMLQSKLNLIKMFGVDIEDEDIRQFNTAALVIDKLSEAGNLSVGISRINEDETKNLLKSNEVYCFSVNLTRKDK